MHPDLHRYLDGELARADLSADARAELAEWEVLQRSMTLGRAERAPSGLADAVMHEIYATSAQLTPSSQQSSAADPTPARDAAWRRAWSWLVTPRPIRLPPFAYAAVAAAIAALVFVPRGWMAADPPHRDGALELSAGEIDAPIIYVQFALRAADAQSVAVAGDFNEWSTDVDELRDPDGDGVWRGLIAVRPGVHKYMFLVNGDEWVTDPVAERYVDDGFGMRNALLAVTPPADAL